MKQSSMVVGAQQAQRNSAANLGGPGSLCTLIDLLLLNYELETLLLSLNAPILSRKEIAV